MSPIIELSSAVKARRSDMGLSQTTLAKLSGLSRATVNQVETGAIKDLSLTRAEKLLGVLGLSVTISAARSNRRNFGESQTPALDIAARTASVGYRVPMRADHLREALRKDESPPGFAPHLHMLLDEAPVSLLAAVVEQMHDEEGIDRTLLWQRMRALARRLESTRDIWR